MNRPLAFACVSLLGAAAGFGIAMATRLSTPAASAGDWLAFTGAVTGVMLTIGATLFIEAYGRSRSARDEMQRLRSVVEKVARTSSDMRYETPREFGDSSAVFEAQRLVYKFLRVLAQYHFVHGDMKVDDVELWLQLRDLDSAGREAISVLEQFQAMLDTRLKSGSDEPTPQTETLADFRKEISRAAARVQTGAQTLRKTLNQLSVTGT